jgi:hypothetical protein
MKNAILLASLGFLMHSAPTWALYQSCPEGSLVARAVLVAAPYDCTSQIIVAYQLSEQGALETTKFGCLTFDTAKPIMQTNPQYLAEEKEYYDGKATKLLVCLQQYDAGATGESQKRVGITQILQNITQQNGLVLE